MLPTNLLLIVGLSGATLYLLSHRKIAAQLLIVSVTGLAICAFTPLGYAMLLPLENRFPKWEASSDFEGIVILGGGLRSDVSADRGEPVSGFAVDRIIYSAQLARGNPEAKIIYTGGSSNIYDNDAKEADFAVILLESLGVEKERIRIDRLSRNTMENVDFVKANLNAPGTGRRWLLVTSAFHMPRSMGLFRRAGVDIQAVPVGWLTGGNNDLRRFSAGFDGLFRVNVAAREWIGLVAAKIMGRSQDLFPSA